MRKEHGQARFLHLDDRAIFGVAIGQAIEMDHAGHGGGHQPGQTQHSVDQVEKAAQAQVVVVRFAVLDLVTLAHDEMPCDAVVQEHKHKG
jgi:hypothetical protein